MKPLLRALFSLSMLFSFVAISWAAKSIAEYKFRGVPDGSQPNGGLVADRRTDIRSRRKSFRHDQRRWRLGLQQRQRLWNDLQDLPEKRRHLRLQPGGRVQRHAWIELELRCDR